MKITYIYHSGFAVELAEAVLVFDYFRGSLPAFNRKKPVYVFASHKHYDHFKKEIFTWLEDMQIGAYILSADIKDKKISFPEENTFFMDADEERCFYLPGHKGTLLVKTLKSTDEGVAFLVSCRTAEEDRTLYHAGDLNWWHWEEEGPEYNAQMKADYLREIAKIEGMQIDAAFVPADLRLEDAYCWGACYFMEHTRTKVLFPMHFWKKFEVCRRLKEEPAAVSYRDRIMQIEKNNQEFQIP